MIIHFRIMKLSLHSRLSLITTILFFSLSATPSMAQKKKSERESIPVIASLNAYSFSDLLTARDSRNKEQVYTLFNLATHTSVD